MRFAFTILLAALFFVAGCGPSGPTRTTIMGPEPSRPEQTISVTIDSIPSGADVYAIEKDGNLGAKIGTTPFVHLCSVARQYSLWSDTKERYHVESFSAWGGGVQWESHKIWKVLSLNIALAKGDHSIAVASKEIFRSYRGVFDVEEFTDKDIALTVPLKSLAQVNREMEIYLRQQSLNSQQNITIHQQKDGLDSINSGLDALIKMHGLGTILKNR